MIKFKQSKGDGDVDGVSEWGHLNVPLTAGKVMSAKPLCLTQTGQWEKSAFSFTVGNQDLQRPSLLSTVGAAQGLWLSLIIPCPSIPASSILFSFSHYFVFILFIIVVVVFTVLSVMKEL